VAFCFLWYFIKCIPREALLVGLCLYL
jgi:hypothetical protein